MINKVVKTLICNNYINRFLLDIGENEIIDKEVYREDYNKITTNFCLMKQITKTVYSLCQRY